MYKFLRIINGEEYEAFLREQAIYKYIPKRVLHSLQKSIKPRVVCTYISKDSDKEIGVGVGIFLNQESVTVDEYKSKITQTINDIREQDEYKGVEFLLDDNNKLNIEDIEEIKELCDIKIPDGRDVFASNILSCLKKICACKNERISEKEVFIISDDTKVTKDLVNELALSTKFISLYSKDKNFAERLERDIFEKAGLALHVKKCGLDGCEDFDFIINLSEDSKVNLSNLKKNKIAIDISKVKCFTSNEVKAKNKAIVIEDLFFKNDGNIYSKSGKFELDKYLNTANNKLFCNGNTEVEKVQINNKIFGIEELVEFNKFKKQEESCFKKIDR